MQFTPLNGNAGISKLYFCQTFRNIAFICRKTVIEMQFVVPLKQSRTSKKSGCAPVAKRRPGNHLPTYIVEVAVMSHIAGGKKRSGLKL